MQTSQFVALLHALKAISKGLERAQIIVGEIISKDDRKRGRRSKHSKALVVMKKRSAGSPSGT